MKLKPSVCSLWFPQQSSPFRIWTDAMIFCKFHKLDKQREGFPPPNLVYLSGALLLSLFLFLPLLGVHHLLFGFPPLSFFFPLSWLLHAVVPFTGVAFLASLLSSVQSVDFSDSSAAVCNISCCCHRPAMSSCVTWWQENCNYWKRHSLIVLVTVQTCCFGRRNWQLCFSKSLVFVEHLTYFSGFTGVEHYHLNC